MVIPDGIGDWIRRRAAARGEHVALLFRERPTTYAALADRIDRLASALGGRGIRPGDRVAYLGDNHPSFVETLFACARLAAVMVPLNTRLSAPEIAGMLGDSGAALLIAGARQASLATAATDIRPTPRIAVLDHGSAPPGSDAYESLLQAAAAEIPEPSPATHEDPLLIVYTSGTTGRPKGAVLTHGAVAWNAINVITDYDVVSSDRALLISPLFHVAALGMGCLPVLMKGATVLLEERFIPAEALRSIERHRATAVSGVPTTFQLMTDEPGWPTADLSSLRLLTCGGSPVPERVRQEFEARGLAFSGGYGMTETGPGVTLLPPERSLDHAGSAGLAHLFTSFRVRDADGRLAAAGRPGEIEVRGPNLFAGYWGLPEATAAAITADGWLRTGDIGVASAGGFLTIVDRLKDIIISGGENISSTEVEQAVLAITGVTGAAVIGVPDERWGEVPHAVITLAPGRTLGADELLARLSGSIARYKIPRTLEVVDELPRTASGKVVKQRLRELQRDRR